MSLGLDMTAFSLDLRVCRLFSVLVYCIVAGRSVLASLMKAFFGGFLALLILLSVLAWKLIPPPEGGTRTTLVWATDDNPVRKQQVELFNKLNPDLYLVIDPSNNDQSKIIVQSLAGVGPDIFDSFGAGYLEAYVRSGIAWDVTDQLKKKNIDVLKLIWPLGVPSCVFQDRVYGFPCNVSGDAIWFNKDMFDQANMPYPKPGWTWNDLIETSQKLTQKDANGRITRFGIYFDWGGWESVVRTFGGDLYSPLGTRCTLDTPEAIEGLTMIHDLMYKYNITPSPVQESTLATTGGWGSGGITFLGGRRVAMATGGRWWLNLLRTQQKESIRHGQTPLRLGVVEVPKARRLTFGGGARCSLVNRNSTRREAALRFLQFLSGEDYNFQLNDLADAMAPVRKYCYTKRYLQNPNYPAEDFNAVWRTATENATNGGYTPFAHGTDIAVILQQTDLVKANLKEPADATRAIALEINRRIAINVKAKPVLAELFKQNVAKEAILASGGAKVGP